MNTALLYFQLFLAFCNSCVMITMFLKVLGRPHNTLEKRITTLEVKISEVEEKLRLGNDHFRVLDAKSEVFMECMLAFIDFEIAYCQKTGYVDTEDIKKAKKTLVDYLKKK